MDSVYEASTRAFALLLAGDSSLWDLVITSFAVSFQAILYIAPPALLLAFILALARFRGRHFLISVFHSLLAVPAIVIGLTLYLLLAREAPLGNLQLLFTQTAMILGQMLLAFPILVALGQAVLQLTDRKAWETARTLGASHIKGMLSVMYDARSGLLTAVLAAFGRVVAEVGCALLVGGSILHHTRNLTTAINHETNTGAFAEAIALGIVLLTFSLVFNLLLSAAHNRLQHA